MDAAPVIRASRERIALAAGAALLVAGLILVVAVLPAEYGVDPLGIGRRLGLTAMSDDAEAREPRFQAERRRRRRRRGGLSRRRIIAHTGRRPSTSRSDPGKFVEYKYRLEKGQALLYSWKATGPVNVDIHAEPDGAPRGYAESYEKKDRRHAEASGTLTAPFSGIHGWYWQNQGRPT